MTTCVHRTSLPVVVIVLFALVAFACGGNEASPTEHIAVASFTVSVSGTCSTFMSFAVFLDGTQIDRAAPGQSQTFTAPAGEHLITSC